MFLIDNYADIEAIGEKAYQSPLDNDYGQHQHIYLKTSEKWLPLTLTLTLKNMYYR
jgi:hypothetical protein